ncbi:MAG: tyrosine recombinase [Bacillota bacterium]|nr:tyrosine recombinase [Bacillota bacterium]
MTRLVSKYIDYLSGEKKLSKNTVESYIRDIHQLSEYLENLGISDLCDVTKPILITYVIYMQRSEKANSSITRSIVSLRSFYKFAVMSGYSEGDPTVDLEVPKSEQRTVQILNEEEIKCLLKFPKTVDFKGYRDKAMLELLYATGVKVSELIELKAVDVNLAECYIICGKGSKRRAVPMGEMAVLSIERYIACARSRQIVENQDDELFLNLNGKQLTRQGFWKILKEYKNKANITSNITPHTLRHTFAVHMMENGTEVKDVQIMLGNSSQSTSEMYKKTLDEHISEVYKKAHPRAVIKE